MTKSLFSIATLVLFISLLYSCKSNDSMETCAGFGFLSAEQIVEVDSTTTSFRLEGEWVDGDTPGVGISNDPRAYLDTLKTTAIYNTHFIHKVNPNDPYSIGEFTALGIHKMYKEIKLIPENITEELIISYKVLIAPSSHYWLIRNHKVILKPKK